MCLWARAAFLRFGGIDNGRSRLWDVAGELGFSSVAACSGYVLGMSGGITDGACAWIHSREDASGELSVSTQYLYVDSTVLGRYQGESAFASRADSYGGINTSAVYLQPTELTNQVLGAAGEASGSSGSSGSSTSEATGGSSASGSSGSGSGGSGSDSESGGGSSTGSESGGGSGSGSSSGSGSESGGGSSTGSETGGGSGSGTGGGDDDDDDH